MERSDLIIVGGGIVGLATGWQYLRMNPGNKVIVLEKEDGVAKHQTGRNSGVLHSGIYYKPGSLKAINCRRGKEEMERFCDDYGIKYERCGKVIVAVEESELPISKNIYERGLQNGVNCRMMSREELREVEPHANGLEAIYVPETGIVDFVEVAEKLVELIEEMGGEVRTGVKVESVKESEEGVIFETTGGEYLSDMGVNCGGLYSDKVLGRGSPVKIVPFRGEYYLLSEQAEHLCKNLIYPVPNPNFPFLGVHFTRMVHGGVECGPNAVLALAREGYCWSDVNFKELWEVLSYKGFWKVAGKYWREGFGEMYRSISKRAFIKALSRLVPEIEMEGALAERAEAGVRAQALGRDGNLIDDFLIHNSDIGKMFHVCNAPSPAATSSLSIGRMVVERLGSCVTA